MYKGEWKGDEPAQAGPQHWIGAPPPPPERFSRPAFSSPAPIASSPPTYPNPNPNTGLGLGLGNTGSVRRDAATLLT